MLERYFCTVSGNLSKLMPSSPSGKISSGAFVSGVSVLGGIIKHDASTNAAAKQIPEHKRKENT
jgi:hypothetical protein